MKYVMIDHKIPICFPDELVHSSFTYFGKITSAGFVSTKGKVTVFGKSVSLNIGPEEGDQLIITGFLRGYSTIDIINLASLGLDPLASAIYSLLEEREEKYK